MFDGDVKNAGIITEINKAKGPRGKADENLVIKGRELKSIFERRIIYPMDGQARYLLSSAAETVIKTLVDDQAGPGAIASRQMAELRIDTDDGAGATYELSSRYGKMIEALEACSTSTGLGWWVELDLGLMDFLLKTGTGKDRTAGQSTNPRAIFSDRFNTLYSASAKESDVLYKNVAIVGGKGEGVDRDIVTAYNGSEPTGLDRREIFIDARDLDTGLSDRGLAKLAENSTEVFLDGRILESGGLKYKDDYQLGDLCTIEALGYTYDARLTEVRENWGPNLYQVDVVFGRPYPEMPRQVAEKNNETTEKLNANETPPDVVGYDANNHISADGFVFPATQVPSADPNTLDDYKEVPSYTPVLAFGGGSTGLTYASRTGSYTKMGNRVLFEAALTLSNKGSSAGSATITLPETPNTTSSLSVYVSAITYTGMIMARISGSTVSLYQTTEAGATTALSNTNFANNSVIVVSGQYGV